jgi:hypothetical protein
MQVQGYLVGLIGGMSGLATALVRDADNGEIHELYVESGFGVRQLVAALGDGRSFNRESGDKLASWTFGELGLLQSVEVV